MNFKFLRIINVYRRIRIIIIRKCGRNNIIIYIFIYINYMLCVIVAQCNLADSQAEIGIIRIRIAYYYSSTIFYLPTVQHFTLIVFVLKNIMSIINAKEIIGES